ncbi:hypothetical protein BLNAU_9312 [Blattamonas nauphoetae]|uniref:Uncharacterized protein n=1 Tax=Blattamonas nauphoetae TaxID=2049346 RepID=A0ABQ9XWB9_9EUKA|nr:hypothetical protein BLNAU_9312 [Blattamonas nauphoetae]
MRMKRNKQTASTVLDYACSEIEVDRRQRVVVLHSPLLHIQHPSRTETAIPISSKFVSPTFTISAVHTWYATGTAPVQTY